MPLAPTCTMLLARQVLHMTATFPRTTDLIVKDEREHAADKGK